MGQKLKLNETHNQSTPFPVRIGIVTDGLELLVVSDRIENSLNPTRIDNQAGATQMGGNLVVIGCLEVERVGKHLEPKLMFKYWNICTKSFIKIPWPDDSALVHEVTVEFRWLSLIVKDVAFVVRVDPDRLREHQDILRFYAQRRDAWIREGVHARRLNPDGQPVVMATQEDCRVATVKRPKQSKQSKRPRRVAGKAITKQSRCASTGVLDRRMVGTAPADMKSRRAATMAARESKAMKVG